MLMLLNKSKHHETNKRKTKQNLRGTNFRKAKYSIYSDNHYNVRLSLLLGTKKFRVLKNDPRLQLCSNI